MNVPGAIVNVVDDDPSFLVAISRLLRAAGFPVRTFSSAVEFLSERELHLPGCVVSEPAPKGSSSPYFQGIHHSSPMSSAQPIYVAVVDDDENVCRSFGRLLRAAGIQPVTYSSEEEFLADTKHPTFDCLVLDIQLGGMSGIELSRQLRIVQRITPFIFITAHDEPETRVEAHAAGCAAYFNKTDLGSQVLAAIRRLIDSPASE